MPHGNTLCAARWNAAVPIRRPCHRLKRSFRTADAVRIAPTSISPLRQNSN
jgi:hypothetical protein